MKLVSLYGPDRRLAIEREEPLDVNPNCELCDLYNSARNVCLNADGEPGGALLIGEAPGKNEDISKRPFVGRVGNYLRGLVAKSWDGPVAFDNGVRCYPGREPPSVASIKACRGYLAQTIEEVQPKRVIALGGKAAHSLLGRKTKIMSVRRGYAWLWNDGAQPVPVFLVPHPSAALRNRFVRQEFEADLEWALTCDEPALPPWDEEVCVVETEADAMLANAELRAAKWISFDYETAGRQFDGEFTALVVGLCAYGSNRPWVWDHVSLENPATLAVLQRLLADPTVAKVGQYVKYDMLSTRCALGTVVNNIHGDTRLWRKLMDPEADAKLYVMQELVGMGGSKDEVTAALAKGMRAVNKALKDGPAHEGPTLLDGMPPAIDAAIRLGGDPKRYQYSFLPWATLVRYVALDAVSTARLSEKFEAELAVEEPGLPRIWNKIVRPCISALERVENWGIAMDADAIRHVQTHFGAKVEESRQRLAAYGNFNPNSPKQLGEFLYTKLGLPVSKLTKTGNASTDKEALEAIRGSHPVVDDVLAWRKYGKLKGTYADGLYDAIRGDGRIHGDVKPDGARSGRLSMSDPNLQNIPTDKEADGKMIRDCFIAPPDHLLLSCDFSQIELRVLASLSGDEKMREIFRSGDDYHLRTARHIAPMLWHIDPEDVTDRERRIAKCFHPDTEVLTRRGWVRIPELVTGEEVAEAAPNPDGTVRLSWVTPLEVFTKKNEFDHLVHLRNEGIDLRVTPDHRMLTMSRGGAYSVVRPADLHKTYYWANAGLLDGTEEVDERLLRLAVAVQADGSYSGNRVRFGFTKQRKVDRLIGMLKPGEFTHRVAGRRHDIGLLPGLTCKVRALLDDKSFPWSWLLLVPELRLAVLDEAPYWDGHDRTDWRMRLYFSYDVQSVDVLQAIAATVGRKTRRARNGPCWRLSIKDHHMTRGGNLETTEVPYTGEVACLSVPSSFVLVRDGGVPVITGQSFNFALIYGMGDERIARDLGISIDEARAVRAAILGNFSDMSAYIRARILEARTTGVCWTWWQGERARRRPLHKIASVDGRERNTAENGAYNSPVQGTANEFNTASLIEVVNWIEADCVPAKVVIPIHDQLVLEVREDVIVETAKQVKGIMESWDLPGVPIIVDTEVGRSWGSLEKWDIEKPLPTFA